MDKVEIEAVYEGGTLKLPHPLPLREGQKVTITIQPADSVVNRFVGLLSWTGTLEDLDYLILSEDNDPRESS